MFGNSRRAGRLPSLLLLGLLVLAAVVAFNYWMVSTRNGRLQLELAEAPAQVKKTDTAKSRLEKRNSELMGQVDTHRRRLDEKEDECHNLGNQLQNKENLMKKCIEEKVKFQNNVTEQLSFIHRLQEQLTELRQEFIKQDEQLQEYRRNSTSLEKKLEYESLQCGQQISALKEQCEEKIKTLERVHDQSPKREEDPKQNQPREEKEEAPKARESDWDYSKSKGNLENVQQVAKNNKPIINLDGSKLQSHQDSDIKLLNLGKADDDAGMPGVEENEQGKSVDVLIDHKSRMNFEKVEKPASKNVGIPGDKLIMENEVKLDHRFDRGPAMQAPPKPGLQHDNQQNFAKADKQVNMNMPNAGDHKGPANMEDEDSHVKADEIGESQNQQPALDKQHQGKLMHHLTKESVMQPPSNQAQHFAPGQALSNHFYRQGAKGHEKGSELREHAKGQRGQFFDENESPADPQHDSKVADYNGDDGNVGEYEADKQAELAYNEEEDGDGGEEDVQDEEEQDLPEAVNNPAVYENRRFAENGL
ncbi:LOW QUALITY PROTEIN: protein GOLM2-like [Pristis pectinata]|uniref:LOW QUALITY PROTEIN: protein GOLM2-like n=1 Tax=Pristis pectinata TaxID=685728 RepID=UPI00223CD4D4|nr:LOW QUALITY PROTEIN: protein GOLM2-like [Pristis pectinata]